ncbi:hypothetical protein NP233_g3826 [Leucocoprinus birnbaumii]|uniref:Prion-inhibition and propagation HeLo domain-containing protein n=1 Tax=Leucocoprinus birnbaumii TaxID=56174 RepID=A0AAD5VYG6_9AGAR|nr:hypothetical protein NP233_g3826 [Leucocoprinus birnbaumii]
MDAAGLVIGVVTLWETCVQVFEVINFSRQYGMDYEILSIKLEVERVRLLSWGQAVGLSGIGNDADIRLNNTQIHSAVVKLLGCVHRIFEDSGRLQSKYGLRPSGDGETNSTDSDEQPSQSQMILGGVFKRAYENLRRVAVERQRSTHVIRKTRWAVYDRKKFMELVAEVRGFNDSLESLFPDAKLRMREVMRRDIDEAMEIRDLQLLQEATAGEQGLEDISETASVRLETLGATISARTELLSDSQSIQTAPEERDEDEGDRETVKDEEEGLSGNDQLVNKDGAKVVVEEQNELAKRLREIELYVERRSLGALTLSRSGPVEPLSRCSARVYWDGEKSDDDRWIDKDKGFVPMAHECFNLYKKKKYMHKTREKSWISDSEDYVLLDPESHPKFENINPGTVTVEGYGLECWDFENQKPRENRILVNRCDLPVLRARTLLRRVDEIQANPSGFGWSSIEEELDLKQFVGDLGITYVNPDYERDRGRWVGDLYSLLNRTDIFADFTRDSSVGMQWVVPSSNESIGTWNFLYQIIVAWELATRLKRAGGGGWTGFTTRILATLIISDLWLKHVKITLSEATMPTTDLKKAETAAERKKAEEFKKKGDDAYKKKKYQQASELYSEAMKVDLTNVVYRCNGAAAQAGLENWSVAEEDAYIATQLDPKYAKAWSWLGMARLKLGYAKRAEKAFEKALQVAGKDATSEMRQGLADSQAKIKETVKAINSETDKAKQHAMRYEYLDQDFEIFGKVPEFHSLIHSQQVEGLLLFAEKMKWPYINEVRDYAEDAYISLRAGGTVDIHLHDWLFGIILPGKWFSFKIMTALVLCTASIKEKVDVAHYYECGLSLPKRSYWRCRTVLGRVLGCLPGVQGLCGWIGPCPPVEFESPGPEDPQKPRHIRVLARRISPFDHKPDINDHDRVYDWDDRDRVTDIRPDEEINPYIADMKDSSRWIVPEPPVHDISICHLKSIKLRKLPLDIKYADQAESGDMGALAIENETEYRASLEFTLDNNPSQPIIYKLLTNPVFVTPPPCYPGPKGSHEVHMRELPRYQKNIWTIEQLKEHTREDEPSGEPGKDADVVADVMIVNATGKGAEVLARAWCSERGRNAIIRRPGGPCFVCAVRAAGKRGLGLGTLIWVTQHISFIFCLNFGSSTNKMAVITTSPRRYRFSITRFEAYEGQNRIYINPTGSTRISDDHAQEASRASVQDLTSNLEEEQPQAASLALACEPSSIASQEKVREKEHNTRQLELENLKASFRTSRIAFLRNKLGLKWRWNQLVDIISTEINTREESGGAVTSLLSSSGPISGSVNGGGGDMVGGNGGPLVSPQPQEIIHGHTISKRFGEILAGREELEPRKKCSPLPSTSSLSKGLVVVEEEMTCQVVEGAGLKSELHDDGPGRCCAGSAPPTPVFQEVIGAVERLVVDDPVVTRLRAEVRRRRAVIVRRRKLNILLKRDNLRV